MKASLIRPEALTDRFARALGAAEGALAVIRIMASCSTSETVQGLGVIATEAEAKIARLLEGEAE